MSKFYRVLNFNTRWFAYLILFSVLLYVALGRLAFLYLPDYKSDLETYLSSELGFPIQIDGIRGTWSGFDPIIIIEGISINGPDHAYLGSARARFAFLKTLLDRAPRIKDLEFSEGQVAVQQVADRDWVVAGFRLNDFNLNDSPNSAAFPIEEVFLGANIKLIDIYMSLQTKDKLSRRWRIPAANISYFDGQIFADGHVIEPEGLQPFIRFTYNERPKTFSNTVNKRLYVELRSSNFVDELLHNLNWEGLSINNVDGRARLWVDFEGPKIDNIYTELQFSELNWSHDNESLPPLLNSSLRLSWHGNEVGQRIDVHQMNLRWRGEACEPLSGFYEASALQHKAYIKALDLRCVSDMTSTVGILGDELKDRVFVGQPSGLLEHLNIFYDKSLDAYAKNLYERIESVPELYQKGLIDQRLLEVLTSEFIDSKPTKLRVDAQLLDVSMEPFEGTPGLYHVTGSLHASEDEGVVRFASNKFGLSFPDLYTNPFLDTNGQGEVRWLIKGIDDSVDIYSQGLSLELAKGGHVFGDFSLRLNDDDHEDYLSLSLAVEDLPFTQVTSLVPFYEIDQSLYEWLDASLISGNVDSALYTAFGSVESDSADNSFTSSLRVTTRSGNLKFDEAWPPLENVAAELSLQDSELKLSAKDASIADMALTSVEVFLPAQRDDLASKLNIDTEFVANSDQIRYWLTESPVADGLAEVNNQLKVEGSIPGELNLSLDLNDSISVGYALNLDLSEAKLEHIPTGLRSESMQGVLKIGSERGVFADNLYMDFLGKPSQVKIRTKMQTASGGLTKAVSTAVNLKSKIGISHLEKMFEFGEVWGLSGEAEYNLNLAIPYDSEPVSLRLNSSLLGITSAWPMPLKKPRDTPVSFLASSRLSDDDLSVEISLSGEPISDTNATIYIEKGAFKAADVRVGNNKVGHNTGDVAKLTGLHVNASVDDVAVETWVDFVGKTFAKVDQLGNSSTLVSQDKPDFSLSSVVVAAKRLNAYGQMFPNLNVGIKPSASVSEDWLIDVEGKSAKGRVILADDEQPISLNFDHLVLDTNHDRAPAAQVQQKSNVEPQFIPSMNFSVEKLTLNNQMLGRWTLAAESNDQGILFNNILGRTNGSDISGRLDWKCIDSDHSSRLTINATGGNAEPLFASFGRKPPLSSKSYQADFDLSWPDAPQAFSLANLTGAVDMKFKEGFLNTSDSKTGLLRLFGVFNAEAIGRRLRLDFSDVYKSGLSYDDVSIKAAIADGQLKLVEPLRIEGPGGDYTIKGSTDMRQEMLDMEMEVLLPIASNAPLAGLMLGAPQIGGAVWLVDKVLGSPLSKITRSKFKITGSWDDPSVKLK